MRDSSIAIFPSNSDRGERELTPNQVASWNLRRLRKRAGMSQERLAELVSHFGLAWTVFTVSDAELALDRGNKGRRFTPDELVLLALLFYVTPAELLVPPSPAEADSDDGRVVRIRVGDLVMSREEYLMDVLLRPSGIADRRTDGAIQTERGER
jgi:transcriptional regulator with XRE-family HTH domain